MNLSSRLLAVVISACAASNVAFGAVTNITQATVHATIQDAIDNAVNGDVIEADPGTYVESLNTLGLAITLRSASGDPADTIIDGGGTARVVTINSGEGSDTVISGFTITNGSTTNGAGMSCNGTSPTVTNCVFSDNTASSSGGGMRVFNAGSPAVTGCVFVGNLADLGGGVSSEGSTTTITDCLFIDNAASTFGGGMASANAPPVDTSTVTNCVFSGNSANEGGGMFNGASTPTIINCTFSLNDAVSQGGGIRSFTSSESIANSILWGNTPDQGANGIGTGAGTPSYAFCDVQGGLPAGSTDLGGNIDADPLFVDPDGPDDMPGTIDDNLRLQNHSPCIDAAHDALLPTIDEAGLTPTLGSTFADAAIPHDLDGNARAFDSPFVPTAVQMFGATPGVAIPDFDFNGVSADLLVTGGPAMIDRLEVSIDITHTYISDLFIELMSPMGTTVTLWNRSCSSVHDMSTTFGDGFDFALCDSPFTAPAVSRGALGAFAGEPADGTWTLTVFDLGPDDTGTLDAFGLHFQHSIVDMGAYENQAPCVADIDGDGDTDVFDFGVFVLHFGQDVTPYTNGDFDGSGHVNVFDFGTFVLDFGCPP